MAETPCKHEARSGCALANGLEILGDRWTILLIRDLMFTNKKEFSHFMQSGEGISTNILTERLNRLQQYKLVNKLAHPSHGKKFIYELTERGQALAPVIIELALWSHHTVADTFIPDNLYQMMIHDKAGLYEKIHNNEPIVIIDLKK